MLKQVILQDHFNESFIFNCSRKLLFFLIICSPPLSLPQSLNGVWVNGTRISPRKPHVLQQGDLVRFGVPLDGNPVEFEYVLLHSSLDKIKDFLSKTAGAEVKALTSRPKKSKRKFGTDETEPNISKAKLYRVSNTDKSHGLPCPPATLPDQAGPSEPSGRFTQCSDSSQHLTSLKRYNENLKALKERMGATQKRAAELEGQEASSLEQRQEMEALQEQMKLLRGELNSQQELARQRMEILERTVCEEERRLAVGFYRLLIRMPCVHVSVSAL